MGRQVIQPRPKVRGLDKGSDAQGDDYTSRLLKLIPAETIAVYTFLDGILRSALVGREDQLLIWLWAVFLLIGAGNLLYLKRTLKISDPVQYVVLTVAYLIWTLTIGGPFALYTWYEPFMGSVLLGLFTFLAPVLYKGLPVTPLPQSQH